MLIAIYFAMVRPIFFRHCNSMPKDSEDPLRTRRSLLSRLRKSDDPASWEEFVAIYRRLIYNAGLEAGLQHHEAEDVAQDTLLTIWKQIRTGNFRYDSAKGFFRGFVRKTTRWRIDDYFRKKMRQPQGAPRREGKRTSSTATIDRIPDQRSLEKELISDAEWEQALWNAALERVKRQVKPKQFQIFDLYVVKQWPTEKIVQTLAVSRTQVFLAKHRILKLIKRDIKQLDTKGI